MGAQDVLSRKSGVITGDDVLKLFEYCQQKTFAIPAINVTSSSTVIASLEAARDKKSPIILQMSQGGAAFFAGKGASNSNQEASIAGSIAGAHYIRSIAPLYGVPVVLHTDHCAKKLLPWLDGMMDEDERYFKQHGEPLFSSHMIDLSEEPVDWNIETTAKYLKRAAPMKQWLEMEIGITGGEEDGVNNENVDNNSLYTQPEDIYNIHSTLSPISPYFSIAAGFGNVHGVYKPGNVRLHPELLSKHQAYVKEKTGSSKDKPVFLVFHGGSGSSKAEFKEAIGYGVVKVNLDTDLQYAYLSGVRDYVLGKQDYLKTPVGNPDGEDKPNKKYFDPRVWIREGEKSMSARTQTALDDFNATGQFSIPNNPIIAWDPRSHNWTDYTAYTNTRVYLDDIETYVAVKISVAETEHNGNTRELQTMKKMASHHPRPKYTSMSFWGPTFQTQLMQLGWQLFELFVGQPPFDTTILVGQMREMAADDLPKRSQERWNTMNAGGDRMAAESPGPNLQEWLEEVYFDGPLSPDLTREDIVSLGQIVGSLLHFEPAARASATGVLNDPWFDEVITP